MEIQEVFSARMSRVKTVGGFAGAAGAGILAGGAAEEDVGGAEAGGAGFGDNAEAETVPANGVAAEVFPEDKLREGGAPD